jgi:glycyl-tRNA synthetase beta chain
MSKASLLVELFTEELPPKALKTLGEAFASRLVECLARAGLAERAAGPLRSFATPRRLAVLVKDVRERAEDRAESRKLMPAKVAFDDQGAPSAALRKRLEKDGLEPSAAALSRRTEQGVESVYLDRTVPGATLAEGLQAALTEAIEKLPIPKVMTYQLADGRTTVRFVRPAHGLVALWGDQVVPVAALGLQAGRITHGHRFLGVADISLAAADAYEEALAAHGKVIASFEERRALIAGELQRRAHRLGASLGQEALLAALLDEVTALVEWPAVYAGQFEEEFLAVPPECLTLTMRQNQKYFPLFRPDGRLTNRFLIVSNMDLADPKNIVQGNQRVVRPRLADARFFFETDIKTRLETRVPQLGAIVHHNKLGSQLDRVERLQLLAGYIARHIGADPLLSERAAWLAKADLTTAMVGEFPELQGIMGRYYALHDGEPAEVAEAIEAHYRPRFAGDALPGALAGCSVALADRLDALAGLFGIGQVPTGEKDPFALRRAALGIIRLLAEKSLALPLGELVSAAMSGYRAKAGWRDASGDVEVFVLERLRSYCLELGYNANEVESVLCLRPQRIDLVPRQLEAVRAFNRLPEAQSLAAANKRIGNILKQAERVPSRFDEQLLVQKEESALADAFGRMRSELDAAFARQDYTGGLARLASLRDLVDAFFDKVMVMDKDERLRQNRVAFLGELHAAMNRIADLSKLAA